MKEITIHCAKIASMAELHDTLARELRFPDWYGRNLDALYDCLGEVRDTEIVLRCWPREGYLARAMDLMLDAARENPGLRITIAM